ncbi:hypothetical protein Nepgr_004995 [Nepenthes gracilis]|uniref:Uncharacterized protein n=1 Tax=Nepenthes gracilis TaxID=150966 RepID=A0AAD3S2V2_NEPGR|nr:hypothetical protein Nepgr_004995 [Nepenthes gracilis]
MISFYRALAKTPKRVPSQFISPFSTKSSQIYSRSRRKPVSPPPPLSPPPEFDSIKPSVREEINKVEMVFNRPRPREIPFQTKVANSVNLIGTIQLPIRFQTSPDGKCWASTVISQEQFSDSSPLRISIIFEDDLAHTAACHLKEKDNIYIAGRLSADPLPITLNNDQSSMQVMVHSINFVHGSSDLKKNSMPDKQELTDVCSHEDLASRRTEYGFDQQSKANANGTKTSSEKDPWNSTSTTWGHWKDLVNNPEQWFDYRNDKRAGTVNPKYPDFKHKEGRLPLWLSSAPKWILPEIEGLEFATQIQKTKKVGGHKDSARPGDGSWKDLVENPDKWWDNRSNKFSKNAPDFKHKGTGEALWLNKAPEWVSLKLPPVKSKGFVSAKETLLS